MRNGYDFHRFIALSNNIRVTDVYNNDYFGLSAEFTVTGYKQASTGKERQQTVLLRNQLITGFLMGLFFLGFLVFHILAVCIFRPRAGGSSRIRRGRRAIPQVPCHLIQSCIERGVGAMKRNKSRRAVIPIFTPLILRAPPF